MGNKNNIAFVRGDTFGVSVEIYGTSTPVDEMYFTCRKEYTDSTVLFQKSLEDGITLVTQNAGDKPSLVYSVRVAPEDTADLVGGDYVYDLEMVIGTDVYTLLIGTLTLNWDVTREVAE